MNKKIHDYLEEQKNANLLKLGFYEKEYADNEGYDAKYPEFEYDQNGMIRYYKKVPIKVSDEEYEKILKYSKVLPEDNNSKNTIAKIFKVMAWIIFGCGFIAGIVLSSKSGRYHSEFNFGTAFIYWSVSFISGMFMLGFGEIISLLNEIKNK